MQRAFWVVPVMLCCAIFAVALTTHIGSEPDLLTRVGSPAVSDRRPFHIVRATVDDASVLHIVGQVPGARLHGMLWYVNGVPTSPQRWQVDGLNFVADVPLWPNRDVNAVFSYGLLGHGGVVAMDRPLQIAAPHPLPTVPPTTVAREIGGAQTMVGSIDKAIGDTAMTVAGVQQIALISSTRLGVEGWAADTSEHTVPTRVEVIVDGRAAVAAHVGELRADVARALRDERYAPSGFRAILPSTVWTHGLHHVDVRAFDKRGRYAPITAGFTVTVGA